MCTSRSTAAPSVISATASHAQAGAGPGPGRVVDVFDVGSRTVAAGSGAAVGAVVGVDPGSLMGA